MIVNASIEINKNEIMLFFKETPPFCNGRKVLLSAHTYNAKKGAFLTKKNLYFLS